MYTFKCLYSTIVTGGKSPIINIIEGFLSSTPLPSGGCDRSGRLHQPSPQNAPRAGLASPPRSLQPKSPPRHVSPLHTLPAPAAGTRQPAPKQDPPSRRGEPQGLVPARSPFPTDPVAGGGGRRNERTTGAEALRAGGPAAPYIRPPSRKQRRWRRPQRWWRLLRPARQNPPRVHHPTEAAAALLPRPGSAAGARGGGGRSASATASVSGAAAHTGPRVPARAASPRSPRRGGGGDPRIQAPDPAGPHAAASARAHSSGAASDSPPPGPPRAPALPDDEGPQPRPGTSGRRASPNLRRREKSQKSPRWRQLRRCLLCDRN
ncbi:translation initiation factor IF-2-like [Meles meles]|uniref:translation initiation factor IF-2-like n=1 Tax=Meles meles TaxID=9662 RepID=UPI001E6A0C1E|nr:translation initiation factor IF-2-like [Meles meles]